MDDKHALVTSITNLINHIVSSKTHQQQIFNSFSRKDLLKIITNLDDSSQKLRIVTMVLIAELLYNNIDIKKKFCQMLEINPIPGKIIISKMNKLHEMKPIKVREIFNLLKNNNIQHSISANVSIWYIDLSAKNFKINFFAKEQTRIDPINCIIGFILPKQTIQKQVLKHLNTKYQPKYKTTYHKHNNSFSSGYTQQRNKKQTISSARHSESSEQHKPRIPTEISREKKGIKVVTNQSELMQKKFTKPQTSKSSTSYNKTINLGKNKASENKRQQKTISKFSSRS